MQTYYHLAYVSLTSLSICASVKRYHEGFCELLISFASYNLLGDVTAAWILFM